MKKGKDLFGDRMKQYESINNTYLIPKLYTVIRLDGKAFSTYTKQFKKPFDNDLIKLMDETAIYLCSNIQGAKFAFVQSDEISIYISDNDSLEQQMWYKGNIQKIVSVSASMAAAKFNHLMFIRKLAFNQDIFKIKLAEFDSRVFQVPNKEELVNVFLWRQQDCIRNSISSVAQNRFSPNELNKKSTKDMKEMLVEINDSWDNYTEKQKTGRFITKNLYINDIVVANQNEDDITKIWYQPDNQSTFYPSKHGRALQYVISKAGDDDWCDIEIKKIRSKWESIPCPEILNNKELFV